MMKRTIALLQIVSILFWNMPLPALADDSDIFGSNIAPNVMILFDSSLSMEIDPPIPASTYNPSASYTGSYNQTRVYRRLIGEFYWSYANSVAEVNSSSAQTALNTVGYWFGSIGGSQVQLYVGKYINFLACSSCSGAQKKLVIAKQVVTDLINNVDGIRFGVMKFSTSPLGGEMIATIGTDKTTMINAVNGIVADGFTPLGEQLDDAGRYFKGQTLRNGSTYTTPIQYSCQPNFVIMVTDGLYNGSVDPRTEATNRYSNSLTNDHHSTFAGTQNVIVHTVGFSVDDPTALPVLQQTAVNGGGSYYAANNSTQLQQALQDAIRQIVAATFSFATPVVPTTSTSGSNRAYLASFLSNPSRPFWRGFLKAYNRDSNGLIPVDADGIPSGTPAWDAGQQLSVKAASTRTIYTVVSGTREDFVKTNSDITQGLLGASSSTERDKIIDFTRGIDSYDEDVDSNVTEERAWKLGDIFHSAPVLVTPPFLPSGDTTYNDFKTTTASRTTVLIAGANDGMLHAFRESDGEELWALIPPDLLDNLKDLTALSADHAFYVDSSPIVADIKIGSDWKTIVVFGQRRGGANYYALDITDTTNPQYLWSFTDSKITESWSEPAIGKIKKSDGSAIFVAFVGGGYDTAQNNNSGKAFFVIDLSNGAKLWEYYNNSSSDDRQYMNFSLAASPTPVDLNNDGYIDRVYIGDVGGQLWKFDLSTPATVSSNVITNWDPAQKGKRLFAAAPSQVNPPASGEYYPTQAIYVAPTLAYDTAGSLWVFFGTGDRNHPNNASTNRFYGIKENTNMTNGSALTESSLTNLSSGTGTVSQGWYLVFSPANSGEKVLAAADVFNKVVFFTTFKPVTTVACGTGGGDAKLYAVNMTSGDGALNLSTGETLSAGQSALATAKAIGTGIPSRPVVILTQSGNKANPYVITGTTNQQITSTPAPQVPIRQLAGWREVF